VRARASRAALRAPASRHRPLTPLAHTQRSAVMPYRAGWVPGRGCYFYFAGWVTFQTCANTLRVKHPASRLPGLRPRGPARMRLRDRVHRCVLSEGQIQVTGIPLGS
jgi:hypothetical protein